ncbi:uncharacterized protein LOC110617086 isoform X2 [Manihot esculenta]|uniref:Uncharacterized protein n=2 Tax=Manihot esculenta TaxID=3983 RepID=A0ACB7HLT7_MANES|nr:uncharacterized protein LOC110617086 isoform X2 [Manihot esculenta]KAG8652763.1 hypothetical protein MANES_06G128600v8 [Manihot esculenta]
MAVTCFVLDLCSLSPPLLRDLKQCLLQLANLCAISSPSSSRHQSYSLRDRIGLCYVLKNRVSSTCELKIAYSPRGNFSLRDFHHAVNSVPEGYFLPEIDDSGALRSGVHAMLSTVLSDQVLYSWGDKDLMRKVIVLSSCWHEKIDSAMKNTLMDAADKCVSVEFVLFEQSASHLSYSQENINCLARSLSDLDNCSFQTFLPDSRVFHSLVKRWLLGLKDDTEELLQAHFIFKSNLVGSLNQISTSLSISVSQIVDGFTACQTCRCHGIELDNATKYKVECPACPITGHNLGTSDVIENSVRVGDKTILFMPSFQSTMKLHQVSSPIEFNIIERTDLGSLSEGVIFGTSYLVAPSACNEMESSSDEMYQSELNAQLFQEICSSLHSMDQGLVCSSYCNVETMRVTAFHCFYILQPSKNGPMLLKRLAGLEEVLPIPDINQFIASSVSKDIQNSIQASLLKIESRDYNPVQHERGFHQKLNLLVKESLQFGSILPKQNETTSELNSNQRDSSEVILQSNCLTDTVVVEDDSPLFNLTAKEDKSTSSVAEEWEQLVVNGAPEIFSSPCFSKPKTDILVLSSPVSSKELEIRTSRILERLEVPRKLKTKVTSPIVTGSILTTCLPTKRPLIPFQQPSQATDQSLTSSQLLRPNFQRIKRKIK